MLQLQLAVADVAAEFEATTIIEAGSICGRADVLHFMKLLVVIIIVIISSIILCACLCASCNVIWSLTLALAFCHLQLCNPVAVKLSRPSPQKYKHNNHY